MAFRFEALDIWKMAREYATRIYALTAHFPGYEKYGLADQMNRAVNSISLNIAEGSGQDTNAQFDRFIGYSVGSVCEVANGLFLARDRGYIDQPTFAALYEEGDHLIRKMINFRKTLK